MGHYASESLSGLIVDALLDSKTIEKKNFDRAIERAIEEIDARKAAVDY